MQLYEFNKNTVYKAGGFYMVKKQLSLQYLEIFVSNPAKFITKPLDILSSYKLPNVNSDAVIQR